MKTLVKHEIKQSFTIWGILLTEILLSIFSIFWTTRLEYKAYIENNAYEYMNKYIEIYNRNVGLYGLIVLVAIIALVYVQFKEDKNNGVGEFLAALPYTKRERHYAKLMVGVVGVTTSFILWIGGLLVICNQNKWWIQEMEQLVPQEMVATNNQWGYILSSMLIFYGICIAVYLFLYMMQLIIHPCQGSLITGVCTIVSIPYLILMPASYIQEIGFDGTWIEKIWMQILSFFKFYDRYYRDGVGYIYVTDFVSVGLRCMLVASIIILLTVLIFSLVDTSKGLQNKQFIENKALEWVFKLGVTVFTLWIPYFIYIIGGIGDMVLTHIGMIIAGVIGYYIANKVTQINRG